MVLNFCDTCYLRDFKATECVPNDWTPDAIDWLVEFIAYDCSSCQTNHERDIYERGFDYECIVRVIHDPVDGDGVLEEIELARFAVAYADDAKGMLQRCADAIYGEERACTSG